jgi:hypothetical protein
MDVSLAEEVERVEEFLTAWSLADAGGRRSDEAAAIGRALLERPRALLLAAITHVRAALPGEPWGNSGFRRLVSLEACARGGSEIAVETEVAEALDAFVAAALRARQSKDAGDLADAVRLQAPLLARPDGVRRAARARIARLRLGRFVRSWPDLIRDDQDAEATAALAARVGTIDDVLRVAPLDRDARVELDDVIRQAIVSADADPQSALARNAEQPRVEQMVLDGWRALEGVPSHPHDPSIGETEAEEATQTLIEALCALPRWCRPFVRAALEEHGRQPPLDGIRQAVYRRLEIPGDLP